MKKIIVNPDKFKQFGDANDCFFYLIVSPSWCEIFEIVQENNYKKSELISFDSDISTLLNTISENSHILVISPENYFSSPDSKALGKRKLCVMASSSTPTSIDAIAHFLECSENNQPAFFESASDVLFDKLENSDCLRFIDSNFKTEAIFHHLNDEYSWHQQCGRLEWGEQQLFPAGEISTLPVNVYGSDITKNLELSGEITLLGYPVLHSGKPSFLASDQQSIFDKLLVLNEYPIIAEVEKGIISCLRSIHDKSKIAIDILESMFAIDSRYRTIIEVGFGLNHCVKFFPGNNAMNEVHAADKGGTIHWGIGLTPYTQYHLDIITPGTAILDSKGEIIFGRGNRLFDF